MRNPIHFPSWITPEILPGLPFRWYGLLYLLAFALSYLLFRSRASDGGIEGEGEKFRGFLPWAVLGWFSFALAISALTGDKAGAYRSEPWLVFWPFDGSGRFTGLSGLNYHGGVLGMTISAWFYARSRKTAFLPWADKIAAAAPPGYAAACLGDLVNGETYGRVTTSPLGMVFPGAQAFSAREPWVQDIAAKTGIPINSMNDMLNLPRHPYQLYGAILGGLALWLVLWFAARKRAPFKGFVLSSCIIGSAANAFFLEYFRMIVPGSRFVSAPGNAPHLRYLTGAYLDITTGQALCVPLAVSGVILMAVFARLSRKGKGGTLETYTSL